MDTDVLATPSVASELMPDRTAFTPEQDLEWRKTGVLPSKESPKPADSEPAKSEAKATTEAEKAAPAPEAGNKHQEPRKRSDAESRIKELLAENKRLKSERDSQPAPQKAAEPAKPETQYTRPKPTLTDKTSDGKAKYADYEEYVDAVADWRSEQRLEQYKRDEAIKAQTTKLQEELREAKTRYPDVDTIIKPTSDRLFNDQQIAPAVKAVFDQSPVLVDLLYVMGSKGTEFNEFMQLAKDNPIAAIRQAVLTERLVIEELERKTESSAKVPEKKQVSSAPPPPREVASNQSPNDPVAGAVQRKDFNAYRAEANRAEIAKRKGR